MSLRSARMRRLSAGFTMIELITVIVLMGVLGAIGVSRFFDNTAFESRAYADQVKALIRYAQKLAISQNRPVYVNTQANRFAVCFQPGCALINELAVAPGGANSGSRTTQANCVVAGIDTARWLCEAPPVSVVVAGPNLGAGSVFYFDSMGRPYNGADALGTSTFASRTYTFTGGANVHRITIEAETGYVYNP